MSEIIIGGEFKVIKALTKGRSSQLHEGISLKNGKVFAVKLQPIEKSDSILREATILRNIQQHFQFTVDYGLPFCHAAGKEEKFHYSLLDLLSHNLYDLLRRCGGIFKIKTFLMVADQMVKRVEFLHRQGYIHRSISLRKFAIGSEKNTKRVYLCGLGQGKRYRKQGVHMAYRQGRQVGGELKYVSINRQLGIEGSRRDDLESLMYCWVKMLYGRLPWEEEKDAEKVLSRKIQNSGEVILAAFPKKLQEAYDYCRGLSFDEQPNYQSLRAVILQLLEDYQLEYDYDYGWQQILFGEKQEEAESP